MTGTISVDRRPLASLVLLAYNQEECIREAVEAALAQTYQPLEVIFSDDCSTDRTFAVIEQMAAGYGGPHEIVLNRNPRNLGIVGHVNRVFELAGGELVVTAAGDDVSLPSRVEDVVGSWLKAGRRPDGLVFGWKDPESGNRWRPPAVGELSLDTIMKQGTARISGASAAWSRRLIESWPPVPPNALAEDQVLAFRALLTGGVLRDERPVVLYRRTHEVQKPSGFARLDSALWRMKRNLGFYKVYAADLEWLMARKPGRETSLEELRIRLQRRVAVLEKEIGWLERGSRLDGMAYALALLTKRTWTGGTFRGRARRSLTVFRGLTVEGRRVEPLDEDDHHGDRRDVRE